MKSMMKTIWKTLLTATIIVTLIVMAKYFVTIKTCYYLSDDICATLVNYRGGTCYVTLGECHESYQSDNDLILASNEAIIDLYFSGNMPDTIVACCHEHNEMSPKPWYCIDHSRNSRLKIIEYSDCFDTIIFDNHKDLNHRMVKDGITCVSVDIKDKTCQINGCIINGTKSFGLVGCPMRN